MDKSGQLTFSDDPLLNGSNDVLQLIKEGNFQGAVDKLDKLMNIDPDYPGLIDSYRTAKFWLNRDHEQRSLPDGKKTADFLMKEWEVYDEYAESKQMRESSAYRSVMVHIFYAASEQYRLAFVKQEDATNDFDLLLNLGACFLRLGDYEKTIETLEYASKSYNSNARLLSLLAEASFHMGDVPKSLWYFREAFFIDPLEVDLSIIKASPVLDLAEMVRTEKKGCGDVREWIPVYGVIRDVLYVRKNLQERQIESIKEQIFSLEANFQRMNRDQIEESNIVPRLINKYLWLLDFYEFQSYSFDNISQIRTRLVQIDGPLFEDYFRNQKK
ncbi:MAG: hypothetical protein CVV44_01260 [Spirochaetae bacterium HGW-Spirochaetae-1]|jgi:tetratricopeptide (TPR) repeat protein|nr:MAG: hypothetical protein CVV44_01260 [Spirochaetae bacterium HGW-Spirochaetae-1]